MGSTENADLISDAAKLMTGAVAAIEASRSVGDGFDIKAEFH